MRHHLDRALEVYRSRGIGELVRTAGFYLPIELNNLLFRLRHDAGTQVMDEDWDTLILLDACRYDMFERHVPFDGRLDSCVSLGSTSEEFLERNFADETFHDTVYVNANVYLPKVGLDQDGTFHAVVDLLDEWDPDLEIAHPETVTEAARRAHEDYPEKRVIVHYMQPHIPFIGEYGRTVQDRIDYRSVWKSLRDGDAPVTIDEVWRAYDENLELVFDYVDQLLTDISGKVVVSADHGNMVGERHGPFPSPKLYGHPWGVYAPELVRVPWFEIDAGPRRTVTADPPVATREQPDELIEDRLRCLGYTE